MEPYEYTSVLAAVLNSNLYINGLSQMDYMEMSEKVVDLHKEQQKADILFDAANLNISEKGNNTEKVLSADLLNDAVEFQLAEAELTKPTCYEMTLKLTSSNCASLSLAKDGVEVGDDL